MFRRSLLSFSVLLLLTFVLAVGSGFAAPATQHHPHASMRGSNSAAPCLSIGDSGCIDNTETNSKLVKVPTPNFVVKGERWPVGSEVSVFLVTGGQPCSTPPLGTSQLEQVDGKETFSASFSALASGVVYGVCAKTTDGATIYPADNTKASPLTVELPMPCLAIGDLDCIPANTTQQSSPTVPPGTTVNVAGQYWPSDAQVTVFLVPGGQPCSVPTSASSQAATVGTDATFTTALIAPATGGNFGVCAKTTDGITIFPSKSTQPSPLVIIVPTPCLSVAKSSCVPASVTRQSTPITTQETSITVTGQHWPNGTQITVFVVPSNQPCTTTAVQQRTAKTDGSGNFQVTFTVLANGAAYGVCAKAGAVTFPANGTQKSPLTVTIPRKTPPLLDTFSALALLFALLATALYITSRGGYGPRPPLVGR